MDSAHPNRINNQPQPQQPQKPQPAGGSSLGVLVSLPVFVAGLAATTATEYNLAKRGWQAADIRRVRNVGYGLSFAATLVADYFIHGDSVVDYFKKKDESDDSR